MTVICSHEINMATEVEDEPSAQLEHAIQLIADDNPNQGMDIWANYYDGYRRDASITEALFLKLRYFEALKEQGFEVPAKEANREIQEELDVDEASGAPDVSVADRKTLRVALEGCLESMEASQTSELYESQYSYMSESQNDYRQYQLPPSASAPPAVASEPGPSSEPCPEPEPATRVEPSQEVDEEDVLVGSQHLSEPELDYETSPSPEPISTHDLRTAGEPSTASLPHDPNAGIRRAPVPSAGILPPTPPSQIHLPPDPEPSQKLRRARSVLVKEGASQRQTALAWTRDAPVTSGGSSQHSVLFMGDALQANADMGT
jgi:hypothetical protein